MSTPSTSAVVQGNGGSSPNELSSLRSKIVEILAGTANSCLTELGYYPGMPQRLQELERQNAQWQLENVKLFQDNQALNRALQERINSQQEKNINALQAQVQGLLQDKSILVKQNQLLHAGQPVAYRNLLAEYKQIQEQHQRALQEIRTLRRNNAALGGRTPVQSPITPVPVFHFPIYSPQSAPPQVQRSPSSTGLFPVISQDAAANSNQSTILVPNQHDFLKSRKIAKEDQHYARKPTPLVLNTQQVPPKSIIHQLDTDKDINLPKSISRTLMSQESSQPGSSKSPSLATPLSLSVNTSAAIGQTGNINQHNMFKYLSAPLSAPPISQRHPFHSVHVVETPSLQETRPVPDSNIPLRKYSPSPNFSRPAEPAFVKTPSTLPKSRQDLPVKKPITVMQKDTSSDPSSADVNSNEEQKSSFGSMNALVNHIHESASTAKPFAAVTPINGTTEVPPPLTISTPPIEFLKRPSPSVPIVENLPTPKRPRLEEQKDIEQKDADGSVELAGDTVEIPVVSAEEDPEDSEDEEIRVGPDGFRLVEDCLSALIEDDEENAEMKTCKLCIARFRLGYSSEPKPFINVMTEELVQHCVSEHQSAWERLRSTV